MPIAQFKYCANLNLPPHIFECFWKEAIMDVQIKIIFTHETFLSSWGQMSRPFVKMMMPTSHGRDRPRCGRFVTWSSLPLVGGVSVPSRKEEKVWKSAHHCWVSPRPKSQRRRKFVETRGCFHPGDQRVCPSFYWTVNVPSRGFGTRESAFISHLWPRQVCTSKC